MMTTISDLKRGDIILIRHNGRPYHIAIYAPNPDYIGDIIHMGSGFKRTGAIRGTLKSMYELHAGLNTAGNLYSLYSNTLDAQVVRINILDGEAIAQQAERWMMQGVVYDEKRLMEVLEDNTKTPDLSNEAQIVNVFEYLKFSSRRNTAPIKAPFFPFTMASFVSGFCSFLLAPSLNLPNWVINFALSLIRYVTNYDDRPKGFNCAGFVLACLGAVALNDEIAALRPEQGWVSLKYGDSPEDKETPYANALLTMQEKLGFEDGALPGLHTLMSEEQLRDFDTDRLINKLGGLALLHPHKTNIDTFMQTVLQDAENWQDLGILDNSISNEVSDISKPFVKEEYRAEKNRDLQTIQENHQEFGKTFGKSAFRKNYNLSFFKTVIASITNEPISDSTLMKPVVKL